MRLLGTLLSALLLLWNSSGLAASGTHYKALTFNAGLLKVLWANLVPNVDERFDRLQDSLPRYLDQNDIDIVSLQEVWELEPHVERLASLLESQGFEVAVPFRNGLVPKEKVSALRHPLSSGLLLAVRNRKNGHPCLKIQSAEFELFRKNDLVQSFARKGILTAHLQTEDGSRLNVVDIHTVQVEVADGSAEDPSLMKVHSSQLAQIRESLERLDPSVPLVLAGDFNMASHANPNGYAFAHYPYFKDTMGLVDGFAATHDESGAKSCTWCTSRNALISGGLFKNSTDVRMDYFWLRGVAPIASRIVFDDAEAPLSDHYGVEMELEVQKVVTHFWQ